MRINPYDPAQSVVRRLQATDFNAGAHAQLCLGVVAIAFGMLPSEILSASRRGPVAFARQTAMYLLHVVFRTSLARVGRAFGRDRTTASHACHVVEDARENPEIDALIEACAISLRTLPELGPVQVRHAEKLLALPSLRQ
jgi:chromosomal replication initiation ATPase DnaA